jgi:hypothetical protein
VTPTASRLHARLEDRKRWFHNEWFFKWHHIGSQNGVQIDTFDGRHASYGGIAYSGTAVDIYWQTVVRGVRKEIVDQLAWVDAEVRAYNQQTAFRAIDECAGLLVSFARSIQRTAVEKDRILRGDGINFPPECDFGHWEGTTDTDVMRQAEALKAALPFASAKSIVGKTQEFWNAHQGWLQLLGIVVGILALIATLALA